MQIYSFENLEINNDGYYDLFKKTMVMKSKNIDYYRFIITDEYEGRLDLISRYLYGSSNFIEELMMVNNIINPFSIKSGDLIYFLKDANDYGLMYEKDEEINDQKDKILLMNRNKSTKKDVNRLGSPPVIKPDNLKQIDVNYIKKKITIINKFK